MQHEPRLDYHALAPRAARALAGLSHTAAGGLDPRLKEVVQLRISQINGCAFCIDMHAAALEKLGVPWRTINAVAGWREAARFFEPRELAALQWAEAVNAIPHRTPSDEEFETARRHFADAEIAELTFAVGAIRAWNMLNASFRTPVPEVPYVAG